MLLTDGKDEFEADGAAVVFSTLKIEEESDVERAGRLDLDARMTDGMAARLLAILPEDAFLLRIKFLRGRDEGDWVLENKFDPVRVEGKKGGTVLEIAVDTKPGVLTGIDKVTKTSTPLPRPYTASTLSGIQILPIWQR